MSIDPVRVQQTTVDAPEVGPAQVEKAHLQAAGRDGGPLRVLAVGINFGPEHTGIAPYTTQLCDHLAEHGAEVTVFTGVPHYPSWAVDRTHRFRLRRTERRGNLEIRRLRHFVPRSQSALKRGLYELTFALNVALQRPRERPDVVVAVVPSLFSAVIAQRLAKRAGVRLVVWVQDVMGRAAAQSGMSGGGKVASAVSAVESWVLNRASEVLVLNSHFAEYVAESGVARERITLRSNWSHVPSPSGRDRAELRERFGWRPEETIVLHSGNMGLKQALEHVVAAGRVVDETAPGSLRFVLMGDGSQRAALEQEAADVASVQFLPPADSAEFADVLAAADVLLVNERASSIDMSLPSKLTSYLKAGRPVVAASPAAGGTAAEVLRSGGGIVVTPESPEDLVREVAKLSADGVSMESLATAGREYAETELVAHAALRHLTARLLA
ncbi:WcaI family glycosyltransferase [Pseudonocardia oroxyli]|uniref:Glycosyltransferase involved in cell wall bisynthesis n=1 Tax=Pseudonocardia oroxyli TaxID=366584 RepID=A0A1G7Z9F4_PSEOR|nr:WcaI family glycosyltransferase [Pseudonocardia oroxyli]SDH05392.1 Glycosyltransferase involved in cell wall bisynthesis [Pseudonocardia oroxyli]